MEGVHEHIRKLMEESKLMWSLHRKVIDNYTNENYENKDFMRYCNGKVRW
jgi:hypothetical protein